MEEEQRLKNTIRINHGFGMDEKALVKAVMTYLQGKANPAAVLKFSKEFLQNGCRFLSDYH